MLMTFHESFRFHLVALSVLIAVIASYTAFGFSDVLIAATGRRRQLWLAAGASSMGFGIWSMHYLGMQACTLPANASYYVPWVVVSFVAAVFASGTALLSVVRQPRSRKHFVLGAVFMGGGIAVMHYTGTAALRLEAVPHYDLRVVTLSLLISVASSAIAIKIAIDLSKANENPGLTRAAGATVASPRYITQRCSRCISPARPRCWITSGQWGSHLSA